MDKKASGIYKTTLNLLKSANKNYVIVGDVVTYKIVATNLEDSLSMEDVIISDLLSEELEFIPGSVKINNASMPMGNIFAGINIGTLEAGKSKTVTFDVKVLNAEVNPINNQALGQFTYQRTATETAEYQVLSNEHHLQVREANLTIEKVATPEEIVLGDTIQYMVTIRNMGDLVAYRLVFTDVLPKETELVPGSFYYNGKKINSVQLERGVVLGNLAPGEKATIAYQAKVNGSGCSGRVVNNCKVSYNYRLDDGTTGQKESENTASVENRMGITNFKQQSIEQYLAIPQAKPDIEAINVARGTVEVTNCHIISTLSADSVEGQRLTGYKSVITGMLKLVVEYTACGPQQSVHSAHYSIPFSTFVVLPSNYQPGSKIEVTGEVEDVYTKALDCRTLFSNATVLMNVKILSC